MAVVKLQCPNCNGKIKFTEGQVLTCPYCGTELLLKENNIYYVDQTINNYYGVPAPAKANLKALWLIPIVLIGLFLFVFLNNMTSTSPLMQKEVAVRTMPESDVLLFFLRDIFDKGDAMPTEEEISSIRYLSLQYEDNEWHFTYSLDDPFANKKAQISEYIVMDKLLNTERIDHKDFEAFQGLTALHLMNEYELERSDEVSFRHLKGLKSYTGSFNESFSKIATYFNDKTKITELAVQIRSDDEMELLRSFTNLQSLDLTYVGEDVTNFHVLNELPLKSLSIHYLDDIGWLSSMTNLTSLAIHYSKANDFTSLYSMSKLQNLKLSYMENLKTLDFVQNMPNLQALSLESTQVPNLESLRNKESLTKLNMGYNAQIRSIDIVNSMPSLSELTLDGSIDSKTPISVPNMKKAVIPVDLLENFQAPALQTLTLVTSHRETNVSMLTRYQNLQTLTIKGSGELLDLLALNKMPQLQVLKIEEPYFYNETANLFGLKHVKTLSCTDCKFILDDNEKFAENKTLQHLILSKSTVRVGGDWQRNVSEMMPYLTGLTALREFTLQDDSLQSVDFMKNWQQIEVLHLENNAITNIEPLTKLPNLKKLYILGNPVQNQSILDEGMLVY